RRLPPAWLRYSAVHRGPDSQHQWGLNDFRLDLMTTDHQIETHIPRLRRYARALTGDTNRADDLVQDTLERAWSKFSLWRRGSDLRAWLFSIMHNVHINQIDHRARRPEEQMPEDPIEIAVTGNQERSLEVRDLASALTQLPTEYREVLLLIGLEELKYEEVAKVLNIPIGTVMSRLARGRERLRLALSGTAQTTLRRVK
ncbi:MAG: RNA polymerase sigma factor, partial [Pseudomonadota bacterium]